MMLPEERPPMERRGSRLSRRGFVGGAAGLGLVAGCGRLPWQAQPPAKVPRLGYLTSGSMADVEGDTPSPRQAFLQGLREFGYVEGQTVVIEWRYSGPQL